jgi:hypothetical protein
MWRSRIKDHALAGAVRLFLNHKFKSLGKMTTVRLDTQNHILELTAELAGESQPIEAKIAYRVEETHGAASLVPTEIECSRKWIELLAGQMMADGALRLPIPTGMAATAAKMLQI